MGGMGQRDGKLGAGNFTNGDWASLQGQGCWECPWGVNGEEHRQETS